MTDKTCDMWQLLIIYDYLCKNMMRHNDEVRILELPPEQKQQLPNFVKTRWQLKILPLAMVEEMVVFIVYGRKNKKTGLYERM